MDVRDFHKDFLEEIKATAATEGAGSNAAFVNIATSYLVNAEVLSDFTPAFYLGTGKNNRKLRNTLSMVYLLFAVGNLCFLISPIHPSTSLSTPTLHLK